MKNPVNDKQPRLAPKNIFKRRRKIAKQVRGGAYYNDSWTEIGLDGFEIDPDLGVVALAFDYTRPPEDRKMPAYRYEGGTESGEEGQGFRITRTKKK